jgi:prevent-host-death family protein
MQQKNTLSITEARKNIFQIANDVDDNHVYYTLTEHGKPKAVIISAQEFQSLVETANVIKDFPDLEKEIQDKKKIFENEYFSNLEEALEREGYIVADKAKIIYGTSTNTQKNKKRPRKTK